MTPPHFEIVEKIGVGGMGEVYRATDAKLRREVALKMLPPSLSRDADRMARFEREAQVLASLNHPNIAAIYRIEHDGDQPHLVMQLAEGEDLVQRLARGRLALDETLEIALQIAEALEDAHGRGIIHRDLKPANIKVSAKCRVKILDFGLVKVYTIEQSGSSAILSQSPTVTLDFTQAGEISGTAAYMSPEQARGKLVDTRTDIWSFGVILYEMLSGQRLFAGETVTDILAAVLHQEIHWQALPASTPPRIRRLLTRCLDRNPLTRLRDIGEATIALQEPFADISQDLALPKSLAGFSGRWLLGAAVAVVAAFLLGTYLSGRGDHTQPAGERPVRRFLIPSQERRFEDMQSISPDGNWTTYTTENPLWIRNLYELEGRRVEGSEGAVKPFWSPRSDAVAYAAAGTLFKVTVPGGNPVPLCPITGGDFSGGSWSTSNGIVFTSSRANWNGGVLTVPEEGGEPAPFTVVDRNRGEQRLHEPHFLPDGRSLLYTVVTREANNGEIMVDHNGSRTSLGLGNGTRQPIYSPTGHLIFTQIDGPEHSLWAVPCSLAELRATGDAFSIEPSTHAPSIAHDGTFVFGHLIPEPQQLVRVDRSGTVLHAIGEPLYANLWVPAFSPDGRQVAASINWAHIAVWDVKRGVRLRVTDESERILYGSWSPDSQEITYVVLGKTVRLVARRADGSVALRPLCPLEGAVSPSWSRDGRYIALYVVAPETGRDLWAMDVEKPDHPFTLLATAANEALPAISPDGRHVAYQSDTSGRWEIYIQAFPRGEGRWQVSVEGDQFPIWNPQGGELFTWSTIHSWR